MGWISKSKRQKPHPADAVVKCKTYIARHEHDEYPFVSEELLESSLPLIPAEVVQQNHGRESMRLCEYIETGSRTPWIDKSVEGVVVDRIVYDCTHFIQEHPGGPDVIENFAGSDCTCKPSFRGTSF
jgi:hypothetical protein